ncbi:MAG TPA: phenylalanine--tRNA ligase subunit alpha, partial [Lachnospiraceae bacterium]|nr:phenylalanine--tRNA ligase subunit alpha [Lachnospiraceae bacterium]
MDERMSELRARIEEALANAHNKEELAVVWQNYLGKKGQVAELMKGLGKLSPEERPAMGKVINEFT